MVRYKSPNRFELQRKKSYQKDNAQKGTVQKIFPLNSK